MLMKSPGCYYPILNITIGGPNPATNTFNCHQYKVTHCLSPLTVNLLSLIMDHDSRSMKFILHLEVS